MQYLTCTIYYSEELRNIEISKYRNIDDDIEEDIDGIQRFRLNMYSASMLMTVVR